jgi:hypothetical protein
VTVAAQIRADDGKPLRQSRGDVPPHQLGLREPVQQQDGRSGAAAAHADDRLARVDQQFFKAAHRLNRNASQ